ncbi:hypothetical protein HK098_004697 [Nowakowskiella sp. JEL0407]|nr:hypothetical protein HK098_004697 [Nowakowskiella sp. JEL0407]
MFVPIHIVSFGFHNGPLSPSHHADVIESVRNFPNPSKSLRDSGATGLSKKLRDDNFKNPSAEKLYPELLQRLESYVLAQITSIVPETKNENVDEELLEIDKLEVEETLTNQIVIGIGCHKGLHRSVSVVERLAVDFRDKFKGWRVTVEHRDVELSKVVGTKQSRSQKRDQKTNMLCKED